MTTAQRRVRGLVVKSYSNVFEVALESPSCEDFDTTNTIEAQLRGRFRQDATSILTGDRVVLSIDSSGTDEQAVIERVESRSSMLYRPPIANVDQVVLVFSLTDPELNWALLDRQLVLAEAEDIPVVMCLNKRDLVENAEAEQFATIYRRIGYPVFLTSAREGTGVEALRAALAQHISVFAGQSGVGKSRLLNALNDEFRLRTGTISDRLGRGRHTTRHVQLLPLIGGGWVADTPGFNYLELNDVAKEDLGFFFPEFERLLPGCRFANCLHDQEPGCAVKEAVENDEVHSRRYSNYLELLNELRQWEENQFR